MAGGYRGGMGEETLSLVEKFRLAGGAKPKSAGKVETEYNPELKKVVYKGTNTPVPGMNEDEDAGEEFIKGRGPSRWNN